MTHQWLRTLLLGCVLFPLAACEPADKPAGKETTVVANDVARDFAWSVTQPNLLVPIGEDLGAVNAFVVADDGIYVVDIVAKRLKLFANDGRFVTDITKGPGDGPGEVHAPVAFDLHKNSVLVLDPNVRRISVFDLAGAFLERFEIPGTAVTFAVAEAGILLLTPMAPESFINIDFSGATQFSWANQLAKEVLNPLSLTGRLLPWSSSFIYVPMLHSSWTEYAPDGSVRKVVRTIDGRAPRSSTSDERTEVRGVVRRPRSDVSAYSASVSGNVVNLHIIDSTDPDAGIAIVDRYDAATGKYIGSIASPAYTSKFQIIGEQIYYAGEAGIMRARLEAR